MCKYCNLKNYKRDFSGSLSKNLNKHEYTTLGIQYSNNKYFLYAYGDDCAYKEIKYCPFCGKLLKESMK